MAIQCIDNLKSTVQIIDRIICLVIIDKNIKIAYKANNKLKNIISNKIEQYNKYDRKGVYKLTCTNCNKFYIGRTNRNFNITFKEHRKDFRRQIQIL